ncbi:hypothetical protein U0035_03410 [Niabella yanshanensis]|uniref:Uncharacterized protein n=1 Tax=Niabella yanshanensis TaxID=577386 RepID=A0ABZ0W7S4_9BACT|nr:hypothetical protein [Niabella yanshanensis]WQD39196.1 hypothetical protein U0035_03410 [Niabella yanshanensis]
MNINSTTQKLKWTLSAFAVLSAVVIVFAFTPKKVETSKAAFNNKAVFADMTFKYRDSTYSKTDVEDRSNWSLVDPSEACVQESDDAPCSFTISVPTGQESQYLNGSEPSSKVLIEAAKNTNSNNYYVSQVQQDVSGVPTTITHSKSNIIP